MTVFSTSDISGLRRLKNVKFGTKAASSTRMMRNYTFGKSFLIVAKMTKNYSAHATPETINSRNVEIGTNMATGVRVLPELFSINKLYTALMQKHSHLTCVYS